MLNNFSFRVARMSRKVHMQVVLDKIVTQIWLLFTEEVTGSCTLLRLPAHHFLLVCEQIITTLRSLYIVPLDSYMEFCTVPFNICEDYKVMQASAIALGQQVWQQHGDGCWFLLFAVSFPLTIMLVIIVQVKYIPEYSFKHQINK